MIWGECIKTIKNCKDPKLKGKQKWKTAVCEPTHSLSQLGPRNWFLSCLHLGENIPGDFSEWLSLERAVKPGPHFMVGRVSHKSRITSVRLELFSLWRGIMTGSTE
jgi:hypothetical protein